MRNGVLAEQIAPPQELYERPLNLFVADFIGSPPMNFLRGSVGSRNGGAAFVYGAREEEQFRFPRTCRWSSKPAGR